MKIWDRLYIGMACLRTGDEAQDHFTLLVAKDNNWTVVGISDLEEIGQGITFIPELPIAQGTRSVAMRNLPGNAFGDGVDYPDYGHPCFP